MSMLLKFFGGSATATTASRAIAKDRLSVILASQRGSELLEGVNLEEMQRDVLKVVQVRDF
jgi:septum formation topological specificity factor MinE